MAGISTSVKLKQKVDAKLSVVNRIVHLSTQFDELKNKYDSEIKRLENEIIYLNERLRHNIICVAGVFLFLVPLFTTWFR